MRLKAEFYVRGGIYTTVIAEHRKAGWKGNARELFEEEAGNHR